MSIIFTNDGWVELGANNALERAWETQGRMGALSHEADVPSLNRVRLPLHKERVMAARPFTLENLREWTYNLAKSIGIPTRRHKDGSVETGNSLVDEDGKRIMQDGIVKYGPTWRI